MTAPRLHYIHDPLCGWCYAARPMVEAVKAAGIPIMMHGGGLWSPATTLTAEKSSYIRSNDQRIAVLTGMAFGPAYLDGLLHDRDAVFWSRPTIAAVVAAGAIRDDADLSMMHAIQTAHYLRGKRVVEASVLLDLAVEIGLAADAFERAVESTPVDEHIRQTRRWMQELGLHGFPSFVLEREGAFIHVRHDIFYGKPERFLGAVAKIATMGHG